MGTPMIKIEEDKLDRDKLLNDLFSVFNTFGNQDNHGLTMVINGKYGTGKTTLLNFIKEKNEIDNQFNIIYYDAWEYNYFDNPIVPLMYNLSKLETKGKKIKNVTQKVVKSIPKVILKTVANLTKVDATELTEQEGNFFSEYDKYKTAIQDYKDTLKDFCKDKKTIFLVDELDRCLPEYQIKVLESIYHMLDIPNLIVVIALDKEQLETSIKNMFGIQMDTYGYLSKFIQYEIDLPKNKTYEYVQSLMTFTSEEDFQIKRLIAGMFETIKMPLRDCKIIIQQLNLICKEVLDGWRHVKPYFYYYPVVVAFMLLLKHTNKKIYDKYFNSKIERNYSSEKKILSDTIYMHFIKNIETTSFLDVINFLRTQTYGQAALLRIIDMFDDTRIINQQELAQYVNRPEDNIDKLNDKARFNDWYYPEVRNSMVELLKIII